MTTATQAMHMAPETTTGIPNGKLGVWLFLASEVMLFATLFTTYIVLRVAAPTWPRGWEELNVPMAAINTLVLITSSVTVVMAYAKACSRDRAGFFRYIGITMALGVAFLIIKSFEYMAHFRAHEYPSTSIFTAIYFTTTGLHGLHVLCGIIYFGWLALWARKNWDHELFTGRVEYAGLYWHFVDIVWIFLFPALYLL